MVYVDLPVVYCQAVDFAGCSLKGEKQAAVLTRLPRWVTSRNGAVNC
jgi:hypothetical protein